jgi:hypothetical protein
MFNMRPDAVIQRYSFAKKFTVTYTDRREWKRRNIQSLSKGPVCIQMDPKLALALGEVYSGVKSDWFLVWMPSPLSSKQRYFP